MRTEEIDLFNLEIARTRTNGSPCESVFASRLKSKINKSYRGEKRFFIYFLFGASRQGGPHGLASVQIAGGNQA